MQYMYGHEQQKTLSVSATRETEKETMQQSSRFLQQPENIPEQVVLEILQRLPVHSLLRFCCVCKVWKSLISDPKFTLSPRKQRIAIQCGYLYSIDSGHDFSGTIYQSKRDPLLKPVLFKDKKYASKRLKIFGSCNGLFLVSYHMDFYLWNPSTRQSANVLSLRTRPKQFNLDDLNPHLSGLCYDSSTDDYKAVIPRHFTEVAVVSFRRKYWAATAFPTPDEDEDDYCNRWVTRSGPIVNEKLHWAVTAYRPGLNRRLKRYVVSFDPLTNKFGELPMPPLPNNGRCLPSEFIINGLGVLDGCLYMARSAYIYGRGGAEEAETGFFELLVMKEYGVGGSWTKVFKVSKDFTFLGWKFVPLCFTNDGEVVFSMPQLNKLYSYNLEDMSQRDLLVTNKGPITYQICYTESLVSPDCHGNGEGWISELTVTELFRRKRANN